MIRIPSNPPRHESLVQRSKIKAGILVLGAGATPPNGIFCYVLTKTTEIPKKATICSSEGGNKPSACSFSLRRKGIRLVFSRSEIYFW